MLRTVAPRLGGTAAARGAATGPAGARLSPPAINAYSGLRRLHILPAAAAVAARSWQVDGLSGQGRLAPPRCGEGGGLLALPGAEGVMLGLLPLIMCSCFSKYEWILGVCFVNASLFVGCSCHWHQPPPCLQAATPPRVCPHLCPGRRQAHQPERLYRCGLQATLHLWSALGQLHVWSAGHLQAATEEQPRLCPCPPMPNPLQRRHGRRSSPPQRWRGATASSRWSRST